MWTGTYRHLHLEKWICEVDNSVKTQCDVAAEKRRKVLGGETKDGYVRTPDRAVCGDMHGELLCRKVKPLC